MRYGRRVERNPAPFPIGGQQVRNSAAIHARLLAISKRLLRRLQHHVGRVDVPSERRRSGQLSGASFSGGGHGLLVQNPRSWLNASAEFVPTAGATLHYLFSVKRRATAPASWATLRTRESCSNGNTDDVTSNDKFNATVALPSSRRII